jgi:hypothetical protein
VQRRASRSLYAVPPIAQPPKLWDTGFPPFHPNTEVEFAFRRGLAVRIWHLTFEIGGHA